MTIAEYNNPEKEENNLEKRSTQVAQNNESNLGYFLILGVSGSISLILLVLWIRFLYNAGTAKK
jgi:hypothetical protein